MCRFDVDRIVHYPGGMFDREAKKFWASGEMKNYIRR